jgi:hypothetical protein
MLVCLGVAVSPGQTKIYQVNQMAMPPDTHDEILRFQITVDKGFGMNMLNARNQLISEKEHGL